MSTSNSTDGLEKDILLMVFEGEIPANKAALKDSSPYFKVWKIPYPFIFSINQFLFQRELVITSPFHVIMYEEDEFPSIIILKAATDLLYVGRITINHDVSLELTRLLKLFEVEFWFEEILHEPIATMLATNVSGSQVDVKTEHPDVALQKQLEDLQIVLKESTANMNIEAVADPKKRGRPRKNTTHIKKKKSSKIAEERKCKQEVQSKENTRVTRSRSETQKTSVCIICNYSFKNDEMLQNHIKVHERVRRKSVYVKQSSNN